MKIITILALCWLLISCQSEKKLMTSWVGHTKQDLVLKWGPPTRVASDQNNGEIYIYETQSMAYNTVRYNHRMFYINNSGRVYYWRTQSGPIPAQQINLYIK